MAKTGAIHKCGKIAVAFLLAYLAEQRMNPLMPFYYAVYGSVAFYIVYWVLDFERFNVKKKDKIYISLAMALLFLCFWVGKNYSEALNKAKGVESAICQEIGMMKFTLTSYLTVNFFDFTPEEFKEHENKVNITLVDYASWIKETFGRGVFSDFSYWEDITLLDPDTYYSDQSVFKIKLEGIRKNLKEIEDKHCP